MVAKSSGSWAGIMLEVSTGPALIDTNVVITSGADGAFFESDSNNATVVQNFGAIVEALGDPGSGNTSSCNGGTGNTSAACGAALNLGGCGTRRYNVGDVSGPQPNVSWLSYGCGLAPTDGATNKNYWVEGNVLASDFAPTHNAQQTGCCNSSACAKAAGYHVCCNNTIVHNCEAGKGGGGSKVTFELLGDGADVDWDFSSRLTLKLTADGGPARAGGTAAGSAGAARDFFGMARREAPVDGRVAQAGPFENVAGKTSELQLWPPPEAQTRHHS